MEIINIYGDNRFEKVSKKRIACRGIIVLDDKILLTNEVNMDQWFIPGGGLEPNETLEECCIREMAEETGELVTIFESYLIINEYYEDWHFESYYFICGLLGKTKRKLTSREIEAGLEPRWISLAEAIDIFSKHQEFADNEMKRGAYLREYNALLCYINKYKK